MVVGAKTLNRSRHWANRLNRPGYQSTGSPCLVEVQLRSVKNTLSHPIVFPSRLRYPPSRSTSDRGPVEAMRKILKCGVSLERLFKSEVSLEDYKGYLEPKVQDELDVNVLLLESDPNHSTLTKSLPIVSNAGNTHQITTRSKNGIFKPRVFITIGAPTFVTKTFQQPPWHDAMKDEF
ncbi:hypothetical protein CK203_104963 [Vitis vinifera]|uniref:Uncharacterized protein n=1 Tax=Vitis vinifera TaxID=29760 RepID=A0A438BQB5_VITVI|nr:hypothetical protein CK203_104963 [Vitis vinifera]